MKRWRGLVLHRRSTELPFEPSQLPMADWDLVDQKPLAAYWRDATGDVASLTFAPTPRTLPSLSDAAALREYCRGIAESQSSGLVEVALAEGAEGPCVTYIYKRLRVPAFTFFGIIETPLATGTWIWMIVAYERGVTGLREAYVTSKLMEAGELTIDSYESSWAQDPYDSLYCGVDRSTLRYLSDAAQYDRDFPDHPLTKVRRELCRLLDIRLSPGVAV